MLSEGAYPIPFILSTLDPDRRFNGVSYIEPDILPQGRLVKLAVD